MASSSLHPPSHRRQPPSNRAPETCPDCGHQFARLYELRRHQTPTIKCPSHDCQQRYRVDKRSGFINHIETSHAGQLDTMLCVRYFEAIKSALFPIPGACVKRDGASRRASTITIGPPSAWLSGESTTTEIPISPLTNGMGGMEGSHTTHFGSGMMQQQPSDQGFLHAFPHIDDINMPFDIHLLWGDFSDHHGGSGGMV
ncbi:hypothetical protein BGW36DRAFT_211933 [Talaromyces proteolyticus]|uniref:C2H2-type domain-containing protein n=1 Tax=Talaromyces proteolyticus TaxID=1131652 RepID=A0AAD4PXY9_9EURO|nr:uncharacterized protein BGW36DRAFT_211933 [Talaromyces proteolyticus]KAH8693849.1 hypothetical protein BGW36DRAFT_211933 [Talaromyces proteolyticus]